MNIQIFGTKKCNDTKKREAINTWLSAGYLERMELAGMIRIVSRM